VAAGVGEGVRAAARVSREQDRHIAHVDGQVAARLGQRAGQAQHERTIQEQNPQLLGLPLLRVHIRRKLKHLLGQVRGPVRDVFQKAAREAVL